MRIAYIVPVLSEFSITILLKMLTEYFFARGDYVKVFYFDETFTIKLPCEAERIDIKKPIDFDFFDIIHSHAYRPDKYVYKFRKYIKKAKTVSTVHCNLFDQLKYDFGLPIALFFTPLWKRYISSFDMAIQISPCLLRLYAKSMPKSRLVYNAVDVRFEEVASHKPIEEKIREYKEKGLKVICSYSFISRLKGLSQILHALSQDSSLAYVCVGDGNDKKHLESLSKSLGVMDRCSFFGFQKNPYLLMRYADVFCCPSYSESFCLALFEAGTIGSSVVCGRIPVFTELFSENEVTFFTLDDTASLKCALNEAFLHKSEKKTSLKSRIERDFSREKMLSGYEAVYESLLASTTTTTSIGGGYSYNLERVSLVPLRFFDPEVSCIRARRAA